MRSRLTHFHRRLGWLIPIAGGDRIPLLRKKILLGRRESCDIALRFPDVSSRHCEFDFVNERWWVHDLGSGNGTSVNGALVRNAWLASGDEISIARHRFWIEYPPPLEILPPLPGAGT